MKKICLIIGARPQFIKHAPVELALMKKFEIVTIHTGQHYDSRMSEVFFEQLNMTAPTHLLNVGSGLQGKQTGVMLEKIEHVLLEEMPDAVIVYGDTNSTLAGALAASKLHIPLVHIESGLRSFNKAMPEEINRIITDHIADILFAPTQTAVDNLLQEGIPSDKIYMIGDVMYDAILLAKNVINESDKGKEDFIVVTLHRPYNTDDIQRLKAILVSLNSLEKKIIFPIHPRTKNRLETNYIDLNQFANIDFREPLSYFELIELQMQSFCIITDSGGIQKEAYLLKRKCITLRSETEWVETLTNGWNTLIFNDLDRLKDLINERPGDYIEHIYGYGDSSLQIADILENILKTR